MENHKKDFKAIQNHLKEAGFIFRGSEIYGGLANTYDYGPLGVVLNNNIKTLWWQEFITKVPNNYGLDAKILLNSQVWAASGHVANFLDLLIENKVNGHRYRADYLIHAHDPSINVETMSQQAMALYIKDNIKKFDGAKTDWTNIKEFNLMFETHQGVTNDSKALVYLRPETAQGIFINFKNVQRAMRAKLPFGIGQIGKSFRNEITPEKYIFRTREFEQMELEYFVEAKDANLAYQTYITKAQSFIMTLGIKKTSLQVRQHKQEELAHYARATTDIEFRFPWGWSELMGIANRGDFDLKNHMQHAGVSLEYLDPVTGQKIVPHVIEPAMGLDRLALAVLVDGYEVEKLAHDERIVIKLNKNLAPYQVAVVPLNKKQHAKTAKQIFNQLVDKGIRAAFDETGSIGKRYRRQDAIGTPLCLTIIDQTKQDNKATIRFRDDMQQIEININDLEQYL